MAHDDVKRRDVLKLGGILALGSVATGLEPVAAFAPEMESAAAPFAAAPGCRSGEADEKYPTSPLILFPFTDPLPIPEPLMPLSVNDLEQQPGRQSPGNAPGQQDSHGHTHQIWTNPDLVYQMKLQVREHRFTSSKVQPINAKGLPVVPPDRIKGPRVLPASTIYGFNGVFPGPMIKATYGQPALVRIINELGENPYNLDRQDFGAPDLSFITHLHNGHTAPESDGNPYFFPEGYAPGHYVDNLYLNAPAGSDEREKQSFFWYHDHRLDYTSSGVYKGMIGLYPIYDRVLDPGDERIATGLRLPGVPRPRSNADPVPPVDYDIPLVLFDCRLDDGVTGHKDFHSGCGETHPEWWGKTFFMHFPNKGFVGDLFTVNGKAYPVLEVKRRKYRFRFLDASISRIYELQLMSSSSAPVAAPGTTGQFQLPDGERCMRWVQIASDGGLLPYPILRNSFDLWPAKRREVIVDFSKYMDGTPTTKGDVVYLVNTLKMLNGRIPTMPLLQGEDGVSVPDPNFDPNYRVPILKFVIGDIAPDDSVIPENLRPLPVINTAGLPRKRFEFEREELGGEIEWVVNNRPFDGNTPLAQPFKGGPEIWTFANKSGWVHPVHLHMEEHRVLSRNGKAVVPPPRMPAIAKAEDADDYSREDVIALRASQEVTLYRNFRGFTGPYVTHCHNLAHEDHAMMFGWRIRAPV
jgi:FtsP/CotA-like multicopper oxidase with cupredoxin domain